MKKYIIRLIIGSLVFGVFMFFEMYLRNSVSFIVSAGVAALSAILFGVLFYLIFPIFNRMINGGNKDKNESQDQ
ncbi:MAG: hypothetical protein K6F51_16280 [Acetatifactor sp.]|nr:hypothetical protein [Acetatifactor sp.]